jgi:hypothetical protein
MVLLQHPQLQGRPLLPHLLKMRCWSRWNVCFRLALFLLAALSLMA